MTRLSQRIVAGPRSEGGTFYEVVSPVTGTVTDHVRLTDREGVDSVIRSLSGHHEAAPARVVLDFLRRLDEQIMIHQQELFEKTLLETGFVSSDSWETIQGAHEFLKDFETYALEQGTSNRVIRHSYSTNALRDMRITHRPYRCVAAVVPQNASFCLSIIILASALYAGSRVIIRPSLQCASTGLLLAELVERSDPPAETIAIVNSLASAFVDSCCESKDVDVIHYIGSNRFALPVFTQAFAAGKLCVLDGQGNGMLYLDENFPIEEAVPLITAAATRYNGETCTSVNGLLVEESAYPKIREALTESFRSLRVGPPSDPGVDLGPLFSAKQAEELCSALKATTHGKLLCGGDRDGAYFRPAVVDGVDLDDPIVREGFFGPALWIAPVRRQSVHEWLRANRFPLSDTVLSMERNVVSDFARSSAAARICVNADPSVESMFEPWGGYPPSGLNPVSIWIDKYRQSFQLDGKLNQITGVDADMRLKAG